MPLQPQRLTIITINLIAIPAHQVHPRGGGGGDGGDAAELWHGVGHGLEVDGGAPQGVGDVHFCCCEGGGDCW